MKRKLVSAEEAVALIRPGDTITTSGFVGNGVPEHLLAALEARFIETGAPGGLSLIFAAGQGDGKDRGLNRLGHEGLLKRVIGGHWGLIPKVAKLALEGRIEGWNLPQGVISHMFRDIAAGRPATISHVGLETFVDPRQSGGRVHPDPAEEMVELLEIGGWTWLAYRLFPIDVALLRGTTADEAGNITMEHEALVLDNLAQAMAARNSGGMVIVQVERIAAAHSLNPRAVVIPAPLVDAVVLAPPGHHMQTYATQYSPAFAQVIRAPQGALPPMALDARKIIARRAAFELPVNGIVNLGIGMPEGVAAVAGEEGLLDHLTLTTEPGVVGGQPASGLDFGAAVNVEALIHQNQQFDFYDGGGLDMACLGLAEVDAAGNVNVSRFGPKLAGAGGFINISQNARSLVFAGTLTAGGLDVEVADGVLRIHAEGRSRKFIPAVEQITFSGARAGRQGRPVLYVTERAVFELTPDGVALREVAPGLEVERDVIAQMDFRPIVEAVTEMDFRIFRPEPMEIRRDLLHLDLDDRITLNAEEKRLYINFEKMRIRSAEDIAQVRARVEALCAPLGAPVDVIVTYDGFRVEDDLAEAYGRMVAELQARFYRNVTRYSGSAFTRMKLGRILPGPLERPHLFRQDGAA
ncbi:CoA-transferase [Pararhodobacter sp. SW119]|uniref:acyl CoA:acetate/3-ketoacid CoA transferase n=1 Tax=Pararhodobacter sp. SW119 TaxID=2780075 RepID=UPI001ADEF0D7|nr:CoA-transferase [Pararhodobacter sp. SW119]